MSLKNIFVILLLSKTGYICGEYLATYYMMVINDCSPTNNNLWETKTSSLLQCGRHCRNNWRCRSVSYSSHSERCILHNVCPSVCSDVGSPEPGWTLFCRRFGSISCKPGWIQRNNSCYLFSSVNMTWGDAKLSCSGNGSKLVEIETEEEDTFIRQYVTDKYGSVEGSNFWLGGSDEQLEGRWIWVNSKALLSYVNWSPDNPSNSYGREHWLEIRGAASYMWNDVPFEHKNQFICEDEVDVR